MFVTINETATAHEISITLRPAEDPEKASKECVEIAAVAEKLGQPAEASKLLRFAGQTADLGKNRPVASSGV